MRRKSRLLKAQRATADEFGGVNPAGFDLVLAGVWADRGCCRSPGCWTMPPTPKAGKLKQSREVHGMAQRGGAVSAFVRLSDAPIASDLIAAGSSASLIAAVEPLGSPAIHGAAAAPMVP